MAVRVLFVEDDPYRMDVFNKDLFKDDQVHWAKDAKDGIRALQRNTYDLVMLDHDLADAHYKDLDAAANHAEGTGRDVAKFMVTMENPPPFAFVHSWNPGGALAIGDILTEGGINNFVAPFGSDILKAGVVQYRALFDKNNARTDTGE